MLWLYDAMVAVKHLLSVQLIMGMQGFFEGALNLLGGTDEVDLPDILLGWCSGLCLLCRHIDPPGDLFMRTVLQSPYRSWMSA